VMLECCDGAAAVVTYASTTVEAKSRQTAPEAVRASGLSTGRGHLPTVPACRESPRKGANTLESEFRAPSKGGLISSQISREIVRVHARLYGRGPTRAKTFLGDDYALCILEDVFTRAEETLIRAGNSRQVQSTRIAFQEAVEGEFTSIVESVTGKRVRAFVSSVHIEANLAVELFLFEPSEDPDSSDEGGEEKK